eukprot:6659427-Pyramimonas_sp.AAC.1
MWADFFARIGADSHAHADVYRDAQKTHLADIKRDFDFMSRFAQAIAPHASDHSAPSSVEPRRAQAS